MHHRHRVFFALKPNWKEINRINDLVCDETRVQMQPVASFRLHLTVAITNDFSSFPRDVAERMIVIGDAASSDPFLLRFDWLSGGKESVVLRPYKRPEALSVLQRRIAAQLRDRNLMRVGWRFSPHVTLGYRPSQSIQKPITPLIWHPQELVLIHSVLGATKHIELARWPLESRQLKLL